jgi:transcriptional regulator with XRE-family HTH domain
VEKIKDYYYSIVGGVMSSLKDKFGKRVKEIRKGKGITQEQLAESVNIEPPNISKIECGMHFPQPDKIEKFWMWILKIYLNLSIIRSFFRHFFIHNVFVFFSHYSYPLFAILLCLF